MVFSYQSASWAYLNMHKGCVPMKIFFGIDITQNKKNEAFDGEIFTGKQLPPAQAQAIKNWEESRVALEKKEKLPAVLRIIQVAAFVVAAVCALGILRSDVNLYEAYRNAPGFFYAAGIGAVIFGLLFLVQWLRQRQTTGSEEYAMSQHRLENLEKSCRAALDVPEDAANVDVLVMRYKDKKGKPVPVSKNYTVFQNPELWIFVRDNKLCLADLHRRYDIPLEEMIGIHRVDARGTAPNWNKVLSFTDEPYKACKITTNQYGIIFKHYYALFIRREGVTYSLFFPPYEFSLFQKLTGCGVV